MNAQPTQKKPFSLGEFLFKDNVAALICALPFALGFLFFTAIPMVMSLYYSFTSFNILSPPRWIGLANYARIFNDARLINSFRVTFYFAFTSVPLRLVFALAIAMLLLKSSKMIGIYRAMYYLPSILGGSIAVAILWGRMFAIDGTINNILGIFGLNQNFPWLGRTSTAIWVLILMAVWQFGSSMLIFLASLKQIPSELYEASNIDGAGKIGQFWRITLPLITPTIFFNLVMQTINGFLTFTPAFVITQGGPMDSTMFYALYMYWQTFEFGQAGYGAAMAWVILVVIGTATGLLFFSKRYWVFDGGYS